MSAVCRRAGWVVVALAVLTGVLAGCTETGDTPTPTYDWPTSLPPIVPSQTVNPLPPIGEGDSSDALPPAAGASNPTQAGLAAEGEPEQDLPTVTPLPTETQLPMMITTSDGLVLRGTLYSALQRPAPGVLMVPMRGRDRSSWEPLAGRLQASGYAVLTIDLRGYGETGGSVDWSLAPGDVREALALLSELPGVDASRLVVVGAAIGANLALNACADAAGCVGAVLLSPGLDIKGITAADALARLGSRPVLVIASENDDNNPADSLTLDSLAGGDHQLVIMPEGGRGTDLLDAFPDLLDRIADWLIVRAGPVPTAVPQ
ncbi:MAG: alpha/beta fold hydrolase [Anaerolineae bacterium]|nr:alpha/beta fold hydrolase [Anaerolineae bacterium]